MRFLSLIALSAFQSVMGQSHAIKNPDGKVQGNKKARIKTLHYNTVHPNCKISISYPVLSGILNDSLERVRNREFSKEAIARKNGLMQDAVELYKNPDCRAMEDAYISDEVTIGLLTPQYFSYYVGEGGMYYCLPHSMPANYKFHTLDLRTGRLLTLEDMFAGYDSTWADTIAVKARAYYDVGMGEVPPANAGIFAPWNYRYKEEFLLQDTVISFHFYPSEVNVQVDGLDIWISIPYSAIKSIIHTDSPLYQFVNNGKPQINK